MFPAWKKEYAFLADAPSQTLQQTLKDVCQAIGEAFDKDNPKKFPVFKKKFKSKDSFRYPCRTTVSNGDAVTPRSYSCSESPEKAAVVSGRPEPLALGVVCSAMV